MTLSDRFRRVRTRTEALADPLSPEDQTVQSMPDVSPTKWHRAHTTWFFETFVLVPHLRGYTVHDEAYDYLFNSYYEAVGDRYPRAQRGFVTRPGAVEVSEYRHHVDEAMAALLADPVDPVVADLVELGLHHEQQHQELVLMDITHVLWHNPMRPEYLGTTAAGATGGTAADNAPAWHKVAGGVVDIGHDRSGFAFDNEGPQHQVLLTDFHIADRVVTNGQWLEFIADGGYRRADLWLSDGWAAVGTYRWDAPLYWEQVDDRWCQFGLHGQAEVDPTAPVVHISHYEADAFARWAGARLPTEFEWEHAVSTLASVTDVPGPNDPAAAGGDHFAPLARPTEAGPLADWAGAVWQWTASAYLPYPGFRPATGAVGEYNGKFMSGQMVLRGGSCHTPVGHTRPTYRNFFPPAARWVGAGVRLADDA